MASKYAGHIHVVPVNDWLPHNESSSGCGCSPRIEPGIDGSTIVIHNSFDGRELLERHETGGGH